MNVQKMLYIRRIFKRNKKYLRKKSKENITDDFLFITND